MEAESPQAVHAILKKTFSWERGGGADTGSSEASAECREGRASGAAAREQQTDDRDGAGQGEETGEGERERQRPRAKVHEHLPA